MPNKYLDSVGLAEYTTLIKTALDDKADLASPALTGTPTAPTPTAGDDSTKIATTAFVQDEVANYLPLTGGSVTGNLTVSGTITGNVTGTASGNLPLSGGTMMGTIETSYSLALKKNDSNNYIQINSGVATADGSNLVMCAKGYSGALGAGVFQLTARDTNEYKVLYGKPDGTLTWGGLDITPQTFSYSGTSSDVSVPNNTVKNLFSFTLSKGTWLVIVNASFANHSTGYRNLGIATSTTSQNMDRNTIVRAGAANGANTNLSLPCILAVSSSSSTFYVNVLQTSGSSLNVSGGSMRFRLSAKA